MLIACTAYGIAKAVGDYLQSKKAAGIVEETMIAAQFLNDASTKKLPRAVRIRARTARRWMKKMGLSYNTVKKGVYIDGHERD